MPSCSPTARESKLADIIEPYRDISHPLYYWETSDGLTSAYKIEKSTSEIEIVLSEREGFRSIQCSRNATYILSDNRYGYLQIERMETDWDITTLVNPDYDLTAISDAPWVVSDNDVIAVSGVDDSGNYRVMKLTFSRREIEQTWRDEEQPEPEISADQQVWLTTDKIPGEISISADGTRLGFKLPSENDPTLNQLYFLDESGSDPILISDWPVYELGGFSPDGTKFLATFELEGRIDLYMIDTASLELEEITRVSLGYIAGSPVWHPTRRYFLYTTNFTTEYKLGDTPLNGEQLYLYSLDSRNERRMTAFDAMQLWCDFAPNGDFLMYSSTPGVISRTGRASREEAQLEAAQSGLDTWRLYYIPWVQEDFVSSNPRILSPDEIQFLVSWTSGGGDEYGFAWGPYPASTD